MARNSIKGPVALKSTDETLVSTVSPAALEVQAGAAKAETDAKTDAVVKVADVKFSMADALNALSATAETQKTAAETMTVLAVIAITRGASKALVTETIQNAATARGYKEGNHRQVAGTSYSIAKYGVQTDASLLSKLGTATLIEAQALVETKLGEILNGAPWRALWDIALAMDPERKAAKDKRDAEKAAKDAAKAENDAETVIAVTADAADGPDVVPGFMIEGATLIEALIGQVKNLSAEELDRLSAAIYARQNPAHEQAVAA